MPVMRARVIAVVLLSAIAVIGCSDPAAPQHSPPPEVQVPPAGLSQEQLDSWIAFRRTYGLRTDLAWVLDVANSPEVMETFGVPMLQFEEAIVNHAQLSASDLVDRVRGYSNRFPEERAGVWIEGPLVVVAFSATISVHRAAVAALFGNKAVVREVRYSIKELQAFMRTVNAEKQWIESVVDHLLQIDFEEHLNAVEVSYLADTQAVEAAIRAHFGNRDWLRLRYDGPGLWDGPRGDLKLTVVDADGDPVAIVCLLRASDPRVTVEHLPRELPDGKCFDEGLPAFAWVADITYVVDGQERTITKAFTVHQDSVTRIRVVVEDE